MLYSDAAACATATVKTPFANLSIGVAATLACVHFAGVATVFAVLTVRQEQRNLRVLLGMTTGLYLFWIVAGGLFQRWAGPRVSRWTARSSQWWRLRFFAFCIAMGMLEEAVTTSLTNSAPLFGVPVGVVYITASRNYWDVILGHSLVVIAPAFLAWVWLLNRYCFAPAEVLLLFGCTGTLMETVFGGPGQLLQIGMWIFVYGLMVYLPARTVPIQRGARRPKKWHYPLAVFAPFFFMPIGIPVVKAIRALRPSAAVEFPPIIVLRPGEQSGAGLDVMAGMPYPACSFPQRGQHTEHER